MDLDILRKLGMSDGEVKVYKALLEIGVSSINSLHEKVGMDRRNIYDILNKLIERGLVSYSEENGKRTFRISSPDKIVSYIDEKKSDLDGIKAEVEKVLPSMQEMFESKKQGIFTEVFKGAEGLKAVWDDMLNYDAIYWIGSGLYVPDRFPAYWNDWNKRRIKKGVKSNHLFRYEKRDAVSKKMFTSARFLPKEFSGSPTVTAVYGNKVTQMLFGEKILAFVIQSTELADNYKKYHKYLWDNVAKP